MPVVFTASAVCAVCIFGAAVQGPGVEPAGATSTWPHFGDMPSANAPAPNASSGGNIRRQRRPGIRPEPLSDPVTLKAT